MTEGEAQQHIYKPTRCLHCEHRLKVYIRVLAPYAYGAEMRACPNVGHCRYAMSPERLAPEWVLKESVPAVQLEGPTKEEIRNNTCPSP